MMDLNWKEEEKITFRIEAWHLLENNQWYYQCDIFIGGITYPMATFKHSRNQLNQTGFYSFIANLNETKNSKNHKSKRRVKFLSPKFNGVQIKTAMFKKSLKNGSNESGNGCVNGFKVETGENLDGSDSVQTKVNISEKSSNKENLIYSL